MPLESELLVRQTDAGPLVVRIDPQLWFSGGTVVFAAPVDISSDATDLIHFKVHRDILCMHSPIFQDMFSVPPPVHIEEMQGVPLVVLPDDGPDVQSFLRFIYIPTYEPKGFYEADYAPKMSGALRLAVKYEVAQFAKHILDHLKGMWPANLTDWDRRRRIINDAHLREFYIACENGYAPDDPEIPEMDFRSDIAVSMICNARCEDIPELGLC
ncbi:hypothetical protein HGRIS_011724 [Hohenbuehelia grisea]|uniref:BTB domain-containing protein n=1 Tax=Hohenbuehelia grisea TaxID=104357 RepID=A0ABR3JW00_9AGAR